MICSRNGRENGKQHFPQKRKSQGGETEIGINGGLDRVEGYVAACFSGTTRAILFCRIPDHTVGSTVPFRFFLPSVTTSKKRVAHVAI